MMLRARQTDTISAMSPGRALHSLCAVLLPIACFTPERTPMGQESGDEGEAQSCAQYCTQVDDHCEADLQQYPGTVECEAVCSVFAAGNVDDTLGNNLACRIYHAGNAAEDPAGHCRHAGPGGDGVCGGNCESFCSLAAELCSGDQSQFASTEECISACNQFPTEPPFNSGVVSGDSFACRLYHLEVAALQPATHCPHIGLVSDVCQ